MGKHKKQAKFVRSAGTTAITTAVFVAGFSGIAQAAPSQGGVTTESPSQGGVATETPSQGGVTTTAPEPVKTWVPVPEAYQQPARPLDNWDYENNEYEYSAPAPSNSGTTQNDLPTYYSAPPVEQEPIDYSQLHLPTPVEEFTAPIQAPEDKIRLGRFLADRPNWISEDTADRTNGQTAVAEARVTDFWRSTGLETEEAERLAAAQIGGGAAGAVGGALAAGVPAAAAGAVVGGLVGGTIGGTSAVSLASAVVTPFGAIPAGVVGTAAGAGIGAGVGAAVAGIPAAAAGGVVGGVAGATAGSVYGAGEDAAPVEFEIPNIDEPAITAGTEATLNQWEANEPVGAVAADTVRDATAAAPVVAEQVRESVSAVPGGENVVAAVDQAVSDFQQATAVPGLPVGMIANAIGAGIPA